MRPFPFRFGWSRSRRRLCAHARRGCRPYGLVQAFHCCCIEKYWSENYVILFEFPDLFRDPWINGWKSSEWTRLQVGLDKSLKIGKIYNQIFWKCFIDGRSYRTHFLHQLLLQHTIVQNKNRTVDSSIPWLCIKEKDKKWSLSWGYESRKEWCHHFRQTFLLDLQDVVSQIW